MNVNETDILKNKKKKSATVHTSFRANGFYNIFSVEFNKVFKIQKFDVDYFITNVFYKFWIKILNKEDRGLSKNIFPPGTNDVRKFENWVRDGCFIEFQQNYKTELDNFEKLKKQIKKLQIIKIKL
jgi:hypothetical protein